MKFIFFPIGKVHAAEELYLSIWSLHDLQNQHLESVVGHYSFNVFFS